MRVRFSPAPLSKHRWPKGDGPRAIGRGSLRSSAGPSRSPGPRRRSRGPSPGRFLLPPSSKGRAPPRYGGDAGSTPAGGFGAAARACPFRGRAPRPVPTKLTAPSPNWIRAPGYEPGGCRFKSCRGHSSRSNPAPHHRAKARCVVMRARELDLRKLNSMQADRWIRKARFEDYEQARLEEPLVHGAEPPPHPLAPVAQVDSERAPPKREAAGSSPAGGTRAASSKCSAAAGPGRWSRAIAS